MPRGKIQLDLQKVEELAAQGLSYRQIACLLGVSERTLYYRLRIDDSFCAAVERGRASAVVEVVPKLKELALAGNLTALVFFLKTVGGFSEKRGEEERQERLQAANEVMAEDLCFH